MTSRDLLTYYRARAAEYEQVYQKPERQPDLELLHGLIPEAFAGRHVLEVACGTGYWTRRIATRAVQVVACDLAPETLDVARSQHPAAFPVDYRVADAFHLEDVEGEFDAGFAGFWWSHILKADLAGFLTGFHRRLLPDSRVMLVDNRYVAGSNWPVARIDDEGNTYQRRLLNSGAEFEVLKNFSMPEEVRTRIVAAGGRNIAIEELTYYWYATYDAGE